VQLSTPTGGLKCRWTPRFQFYGKEATHRAAAVRAAAPINTNGRQRWPSERQGEVSFHRVPLIGLFLCIRKATVALWRGTWQVIVARRDLAQLVDLDDRMLADIGLILLRHNPSLPRISQFCRTAWTSWQAFDDSADQPSVHCRNRVRDVPLRPQWRILWVGNGRVRQVAGAARWNMVLRGESSPVRR
jgi:hypothetical protein